MRQIKTDGIVMDRYMRHFGKSREEVVSMFEGLKLDELPSDGVYLVYNVPEWEEIRARVLLFRQGRRVWEDATGQPVLIASCGNPMVRGTDDGTPNLGEVTLVKTTEEVRDMIVENSLQSADLETLIDLPTAPDSPEMSALALIPTAPSAPGISALPIAAILLPFAGGALLSGGGRGGVPPIPEPATLLAFGGGLALLAARRRRPK